ncbi:hypothetical protein Taro_052096 [Colocasia esculenta]|uniref:RNase H type-1 domain-containing protein n=1 Tax=Colocasia esculenta TaxID=4460 RepID=A0A843XIC6_COLES|nr:hypothetical protein [Colocasia esculenta]
MNFLEHVRFPRRDSSMNAPTKVDENIKKAEIHISDCQQRYDSASTPSNQSTLNEANAKLMQILHWQELFWCQKSRIQWLQEGDRNTAFYHAAVRSRRSRNFIHRLKIRCKMKFEQVACSTSAIRNHIHYMVNVGLENLVFKQYATPPQMALIKEFGFSYMPPVKMVRMVRWIPPLHGPILNVDGASKGNPGPCGGGGIDRTSNGTVLFAFAHFYGVGTSLLAECHAMCDGVQMALEKGDPITLISTDSLVLVNSLRSGTPPSWECLRWWWLIHEFVQQHNVEVKHVSLEGVITYRLLEMGKDNSKPVFVKKGVPNIAPTLRNNNNNFSNNNKRPNAVRDFARDKRVKVEGRQLAENCKFYDKPGHRAEEC